MTLTQLIYKITSARTAFPEKGDQPVYIYVDGSRYDISMIDISIEGYTDLNADVDNAPETTIG